MITLNAAHFSASKPNSSVARIKCPVEETGRNSVIPSTMPRMMAMIRIGTSAGRRQVDLVAGELTAFVKAAEPFVRDRGERRRPDPERRQARSAVRGDIVLAEHQPLVAGQRRARQPAEARQQAREHVGKLDDVAFLAGELEDRQMQLLHRHNLRSANLIGLGAISAGFERGLAIAKPRSRTKTGWNFRSAA